jgi:hypothetical protein
LKKLLTLGIEFPISEIGALKAENQIRDYYGFALKPNYTDSPYYYSPGELPALVYPPFEVNAE